MNKKNRNPVPGTEGAMPPRKKKKKGSGLLGRIIRRFFLVLFTVVILAAAALVLVMNLVFNGPSPAARDVLTMSLTEASATKWVPALFLGEEKVEEIRTSSVQDGLEDDVTDISQIVVQANNVITGSTNEWDNYPDGIRIETRYGDTYTAHIMLIRDPSQVYMGTSTEKFSTSIPGKRLTEVMDENPDVIAAINAGAFFDDGTVSATVGSTPLGLVVSKGDVVWTSGRQPGNFEGFAGFNEDNILVVSKTNLSQSEAENLKIRDGCCFGPVLIMNGEVNLEAYNDKSGMNPRTAIGQRSDGTVIIVCADGRQVGSLGATYADMVNVMQEYGAVNACNMDGGSSSIMMYRDVNGKLGTASQDAIFVNTPSLIQSKPRRMPNFWLVRAAS